jgi:hypothetical protein
MANQFGFLLGRMPLAPTASITVSPNKLMYGTAPQVLVSWNSTNAVSCKANTDSGAQLAVAFPPGPAQEIVNVF